MTINKSKSIAFFWTYHILYFWKILKYKFNTIKNTCYKSPKYDIKVKVKCLDTLKKYRFSFNVNYSQMIL